MSIKNLSEPARLEQLAEECAELGHAALKYARVKRGENATPVTAEEATESVREEAAGACRCRENLHRKGAEMAGKGRKGLRMIVKCEPTTPGKTPCPLLRYCLARLTDRTITGCGIPLWYAGIIKREEIQVEHTVREVEHGRPD